VYAYVLFFIPQAIAAVKQNMLQSCAKLSGRSCGVQAGAAALRQELRRSGRRGQYGTFQSLQALAGPLQGRVYGKRIAVALQSGGCITGLFMAQPQIHMIHGGLPVQSLQQVPEIVRCSFVLLQPVAGHSAQVDVFFHLRA
jgi:hypothetical protein